MNRLIEFRAWDKKNKKWWNDGKSFGFEDMQQWEDWPRGDADLEFVQYTGLKDKNGTPIFESDIVLIPDQYTNVITDDGRGPIETANHLCPVIFKEGEVLFVVEDKADFLDIGEYSYRELKDEVGVDEVEVIGNTWEHPELV